MSERSTSGGPPPGWYRESAAAADLRWWNGRAWTEHRSPATRTEILQPPLPPDTPVHTVWVWLLSLVPLVALAGEQPLLAVFRRLADAQQMTQPSPLGRPGPTSGPLPGSGDLVTAFAFGWATDLALIGLVALDCWLDERVLRRRGIVRPFPWGWGFLTGVYLVGRTAVLRRRVGRGQAPLLLGAVLLVVAMAVQLAEFLAVVASIAPLGGG